MNYSYPLTGWVMPILSKVRAAPSCNTQWKGEEGNIPQWTGLEFAESQTAVENREKLSREIKSGAQKTSQLRDRWRWRRLSKRRYVV